MKSAFPGMDPYLEAYWRDVHARLIIYVCDQLQDQLGGNLRARVEERLVVESDDVAVRAINPDARIFESATLASYDGVALAESEFSVASEDQTETFIEIIERGRLDRLITVIDLLTPDHKLSREAWYAGTVRRRQVRMAGANLVEIDLTRAGHRRLAVWPIPKSHRTTFNACVTRALGRSEPRAEIYAMPLQQPLPPIRVPLRPTDKDAVIDLQPLVEQAYRRGAYDDIDYSVPPHPPLSRADAAWAGELLAALNK